MLCLCRLTEEREVVVYVDLHGHSRKQNVFIYGCENRGMPSRRLRERIFPVMLGKNAPTKVHISTIIAQHYNTCYNEYCPPYHSHVCWSQ